MTYFKIEEFACPCCTKSEPEMSPLLLEQLDQAQFLLERPIVIASGIRCSSQAESNSCQPVSHLKGFAVDIKCLHSSYRMKLLKALLAVGFNRIGVANTFVHVDVDPCRPSNMIWVYR